MSSVLITRPQPYADEFAEKLYQAGFDVYIAPMMGYVEAEADFSDLLSYQALLFTSAQAVKTFSKQSEERDIPVLVVGDATGAVAKEYGFSRIYSAQGNSLDVIELMRMQKESLSLESVLHVCSDDTPDDIQRTAAEFGVTVLSIPVYKTELFDELPEDVLKAIQEGKIDIVTLFSSRTAQNFVRIMKEESLRGASVHMEAVCISEKTAVALRGLPWRSIRVARYPSMDSVIDVLRNKDKGESVYLSKPLIAEHVIGAFKGVRPLAKRLGITASTVQGWQKRGTIPVERMELILRVSKEDKISTKLFWGNKQAVLEAYESGKLPNRRNNKPAERRQEQIKLDENNYLRTARYMGPDRRKKDRRLRKKDGESLLFKEKLQFLNSSFLSFFLFLFLILIVGFFLMAPEYMRLKENADYLKEDSLVMIKENPNFSLGNRLSHQVEKAGVFENVFNSVKDFLFSYVESGLDLMPVEALKAGNIEGVLSAFDRMAELKATPNGETVVTESIDTLRRLVSKGSMNPEGLNKSLVLASKYDHNLKILFDKVDNKDLAAAGVLLLLNEFRSNVDTHRPFEEDLAVLQKFAGKDPEMNRALQRLSPYAKNGIVSRNTLQKEFKNLAFEIIQAKMSGEDADVERRALERFNKLSAATRVDDVPGKDTAAVVARAQIFLDKGDVKNAMRELQSLEGGSAVAVAPWMDDAAGNVFAEQSSEVLSEGVLNMLAGSGGGDLGDILAYIVEKARSSKSIYVSPGMSGDGKNYGGVIAPIQ